MFKSNRQGSPQREREGLVSHILLQQGDVPDDRLSVTWVEIALGGHQRPHHHAPEQIYVIVRGNGHMQVGEEETDVAEGDLVYIPSDVVHSIENLGDTVLTYISAATPAFDLTALYDTGDLRRQPG